MTENKIRKMLAEVDFSKETDLRGRLREQLFGKKVVRLNSRQLIEDDDMLDWVNAAGQTIRRPVDDIDDPTNDPRGGSFKN